MGPACDGAMLVNNALSFITEKRTGSLPAAKDYISLLLTHCHDVDDTYGRLRPPH